MKHLPKLYILALAIVCCFTTGCDYRYRTISSGASAQDVQQGISSLVGSMDSTSGSQVQAFSQDPDTIVYFSQWSQGNQPLGPLEVTAPIDLASISKNKDEIGSVSSIKIYFFNKDMHDGSFQNLLVLDYQVNGASDTIEYYSNTDGSSGAGLIQDGNFSTVLSGSTNIQVESSDVNGGHLDSDGIQLKIFDANDPSISYGKISGLEGFPP